MTAVVHTPTPCLRDSIEFYEKLGFKKLFDDKTVIYTDGKAVIEVNPARFARAGVKLYRPSWKEAVAGLKELTEVLAIDGGYQLVDPGGVWMYLMESTPDLATGQSGSSFSVLGNYAGLSFEIADFPRTIRIYELLGFLPGEGAADKGYLSFVNNGFIMTIMKPLSCPHLFFNPSMTYFNGKKNLSVIEKIRSLNIPITEEITCFNKEGIVDNVIIRDPGGYGFFIFSD